MNRLFWWLANSLSQTLSHDERDAVRGDLAESGESGASALRQVFGLAARREAARWRTWHRWVLLAASIALAAALTPVSRRAADRSAIYLWLYAGNWVDGYLRAGARADLLRSALSVARTYGELALAACAGGFTIGCLTRSRARGTGVLLGAALLAAVFVAHPHGMARDRADNAAVFALPFYRVVLPLLVQSLLVIVPAFWCMRLGRRLRLATAMAALVGIAAAADAPGVHATLQPFDARKAAPEIHLKDGAGKTVTLKKYRGKVILLDFWATWCHGCKEEIPWFVEFSRKYGRKGLTVVGVSLDGDGWKVLRPFLKTAHIPYPIVLGDDPTAKQYAIENMPDTFLIDREGRVAAAYAGLVDKDDVEKNIRAMLVK